MGEYTAIGYNPRTMTIFELQKIVEESKGTAWNNEDATVLNAIRGMQVELEKTLHRLVKAKLQDGAVSARKLAETMGVSQAWISHVRNDHYEVKKVRTKFHTVAIS